MDLLESILGPSLFRKYVHVLLTDRGPEFSLADAMEHGADRSLRTRVFYCDPMQSGQKGTLENKHIELRYILPKGTDLKALGLHGRPEPGAQPCGFRSGRTAGREEPSGTHGFYVS